MSEIAENGGPIFVDTDDLFSHMSRPQERDQNLATEENANTIVESDEDLIIKEEEIEKDPYQRLVCPECKRYTATSHDKMLRHIRKVHRGENPYQCYMCDYSTYNSAVFEEHVNIHQGIKPFKCSFCDYRSASKKNAKKHENIHRKDNPLRCTSCDFIARNPQTLRGHKSKVHKIEDDKTLTCKYCQRKFVTRTQLRTHYNHSTRKCPECPFVVCTKKLYDAHLEFSHGIKKEQKEQPCIFTCAHCPWTSNNKSRILLHLIHHPNQTVDENVIDITILRNCGIME